MKLLGQVLQILAVAVLVAGLGEAAIVHNPPTTLALVLVGVVCSLGGATLVHLAEWWEDRR